MKTCDNCSHQNFCLIVEAIEEILSNSEEPIEYCHLTREDLVLVVEILRSDCERLRSKLDDLEGVIR